MIRPGGRHGPAFDALVAERLAGLEADGHVTVLDLDEDGMLWWLAEGQRKAGRSLYSDAWAAAFWRYWVDHSPHAKSLAA